MGSNSAAVPSKSFSDAQARFAVFTPRGTVRTRKRPGRRSAISRRTPAELLNDGHTTRSQLPQRDCRHTSTSGLMPRPRISNGRASGLGCDHHRNHQPSFTPTGNGRPRCRRQPPTSKPSISSSGVRSSMGLPEDCRRCRCRSLPERDQERPTPSPSGRPSDRSGCRPPPDPVDDVFAARRLRVSKRVERIARKVLGEKRRDHDGRADLGWHHQFQRISRQITVQPTALSCFPLVVCGCPQFLHGLLD